MDAEAKTEFRCEKDEKRYKACEKIFVWDDLKQMYISLLEKNISHSQYDRERNLRVIMQTEVSMYIERLILK